MLFNHCLALFTCIFSVFVYLPLPACAEPSRVVVLPCYEADTGSADPEAAIHYRRALRFINNQLVNHGFEVINGEARQRIEEEYNRLAERAQSDSVLAARDMCRRYMSDIAYLVWLDVRTSRTKEGICRAVINLEGEGHDAAGRDLGAGLAKTVIREDRDCERAMILAEKAVGDLIGRSLTGKTLDISDTGSVSAAAANINPLPARTLEEAAQALIARLSFAYTGGAFGLKIEKAAPEGAGQPALQLGRELDPLIAMAVDMSPDLPVSLTPRRHYILHPGYGLIGDTLEIRVRLLDASARVQATATTRIRQNLVAADLFKPWVHEAIAVCTEYRDLSDSLPAHSTEARLVMDRLGRILSDIGLSPKKCQKDTVGHRVVVELNIHDEKNRNGFSLIRVAVRIAALDPKGGQTGVFENEQSKPFRSYRDKSVRQAINAIMNHELEETLARALLADRP